MMRSAMHGIENEVTHLNVRELQSRGQQHILNVMAHIEMHDRVRPADGWSCGSFHWLSCIIDPGERDCTGIV